MKIRDVTYFYSLHLKEIQYKNYNAKALISTQGTGKSTAMRKDFSLQENALYVKASGNILPAELNKLQEETGDEDAFIVPTLENTCSTYIYAVEYKDQHVLIKVMKYRNMGIPADAIHKFICNNKACSFPIRDKSIAGKAMLSFNGLLTRIAHNKETGGQLIGHPSKIYIDESDEFLNMKTIKFHDSAIYDSLKNSAITRMVNENPYINITYIENSSLLDDSNKEFKKLIKSEESIEDNKERIEDLFNAILILKHGYINEFVDKYGTVIISPMIIDVFKYVIEKPDVQLVFSSAKLGKNLIEKKQIELYYYALREHIKERMRDQLKFNSLPEEKTNNMLLFYWHEKIKNKEIKFYSTPPPISRTQLYLLSELNHSLSNNRYKVKTDKRGMTREEESKMKARMKEISDTVGQALQMIDTLYNIKIEGKKVLFITFKEMVDFILKMKKRWNDYSRSPLFRYNLMKWFSNDMHGINAPDFGYEFIIIYGDPICEPVAKFCSKLNLVKDKSKLQRGFALKEDIDISYKELVIPSLLSEILEGIHRSRSNVIYSDNEKSHPKIPVLAISNLLNPDNEEDRKIVMETLKEDNIELHDMNDPLEQKRYKKTRDVKITSVDDFEQVHFKLSDPNKNDIDP